MVTTSLTMWAVKALCALCVGLALLRQAHGELAVTLVRQNFTSVLEQLKPDTDTVVEFYASWCPSCRHFQPTYERIAQYFTQDLAPTPAVVIARLDCAIEFDTCSSFNVTTIPTMIVGKASALVEAFKTDRSSSLSRIDTAGKDVAGLISALGAAMGRSFPYTALPALLPPPADALSRRPAGVKTEDKAAVAVPDPSQALVTHSADASAKGGLRWQRRAPQPHADLRDIIAATLQLYEQIVHETKQLHNHREQFLDFWTLVEEAHPDVGCRDGVSEMLRNVEIWWPPGAGALWTPSPDMRAFLICRQPQNFEPVYHQCLGSRPDSRGFTCGLWMLLHSLAAGVRHRDGAQTFMRGLDSFIRSFFLCEECRANFLKQLANPEIHSLGTRHDAVMWLWRTHNRVNARLAQEEASKGYGDPEYPKIQFPSAADCQHCRGADGAFHEDATYEFLVRYYRPGAPGNSKAAGLLDHFEEGGGTDRHRPPAHTGGLLLRVAALLGLAILAAYGACKWWLLWIVFIAVVSAAAHIAMIVTARSVMLSVKTALRGAS